MCKPLSKLEKNVRDRLKILAAHPHPKLTSKNNIRLQGTHGTRITLLGYKKLILWSFCTTPEGLASQRTPQQELLSEAACSEAERHDIRKPHVQSLSCDGPAWGGDRYDPSQGINIIVIVHTVGWNLVGPTSCGARWTMMGPISSWRLEKPSPETVAEWCMHVYWWLSADWGRWPGMVASSSAWSAEEGRWPFLCPGLRMRIWSPETGSAVPVSRQLAHSPLPGWHVVLSSTKD